MAILVHSNTRVLVHGITGKTVAFHMRHCLAYGTKVVAGVRPGKGGQVFNGRIPIYDTARQAVAAQGIDASLIFVPAAGAADAILEAADAEIPLIVAITEGIPINDMVRVKERLKFSSSRLLGPNCPGIITPGQTKLGIMPSGIHRPGSVGVVSRSGTLGFEAAWQLSRMGLGQSTCVGIGGDPIHGMSHRDVVELFHEDPDTQGIVLVGEIGGEEEEEAAAFIEKWVKKPVVAYIAGITAPPERRMGHAGAIISGKRDTPGQKIAFLEKAGIAVARNLANLAATYAERAAIGVNFTGDGGLL
jgi:succinyl-CoA synthetase alpha subunit